MIIAYRYADPYEVTPSRAAYIEFTGRMNRLNNDYCSNPANHYGRSLFADETTKAARELRNRYCRASNYLLRRDRRNATAVQFS